MKLFNKKINDDKYNKIKSFIKHLNDLLASDSFISKKMYINEYNEIKSAMNEYYTYINDDTLKSYCKKIKCKYNDLIKDINKIKRLEYIILEHNDNFVNTHLESDKEYLDNIFTDGVLLDEEQRKVVLRDEDYTLVVSGAGGGKTTTISAKIKYLVERKNIDKDKILVISFTKKATNEIKSRLKKLNLDIDCSTFHKIGYKLTNTKNTYSVVNNNVLYNTINDHLKNCLNSTEINKIILFFSSYLNIPFDEQTLEDINKFKEDNLITLKSDLSEKINEYVDSNNKYKITINNEKVRSYEECKIANFLYINGIEYEYEPSYPYNFDDSCKIYTPDFLIKQNDKEVYLEHFGISEDLKSSKYTDEVLNEYIRNMKSKIRLHKEHNTNLIYTFSKYNDGVDLIKHLEKLLIDNGFTLDNISKKELYKDILSKAEDKYFNKLSNLIRNFINKFKVNDYDETHFENLIQNEKNVRNKIFYELAYSCYLKYKNILVKENKIDFSDMINFANNKLSKMESENTKLEYDYIFVDEYQDVSSQRFNLCEKLSKVTNAKIVALGDDFQSIYRFSGSRLELFTDFKDKMGYCNLLKITKTYRNSQELIDVTGPFVMKNNKQIKKDLKSDKHLKYPIKLFTYDDTFDKENKEEHKIGDTVMKAIEEIVNEFGETKSILLLGRYGFDGYKLTNSNHFNYADYKIKCVKYPNLKLEFMTVHSSKGLGSDNVIIINAKNANYGFPSKIEDDPVLKCVTSDSDEMEYAEERRLFYVALTRTKNRVYIITPKNNPSNFVIEIMDNNNVYKDGKISKTNEYILKERCPNCNYPLQKRISKGKFNTITKTLYICTNDTEACGYITNDLEGGIHQICKCIRCKDGYLVIKPVKDKNGNVVSRMLGCTNYKQDGTGCNNKAFLGTKIYENIDVTKSIYKDTMNIDELIYCGYKIKNLILLILNVIKMLKVDKSFSTTTHTLAQFLTGKQTKPITSFNLQDHLYFGCVRESKEDKLLLLINKLIDKKIIVKENNQYNNLIVSNIKITDDLVLEIFKSTIKYIDE